MLDVPPTIQFASYFAHLRDRILLRLFGTLDCFSYMACSVMAISGAGDATRAPLDLAALLATAAVSFTIGAILTKKFLTK